MSTEFIKVVRPDGTVDYVNKDHDVITANPPVPPENYVVIPEEEMQEWIRTEYQRKRSLEYPSITDQLDALYKAGAFPEEMAAIIQAVKDKYPKV